jgi:hypothetical protein
MIAVFGFAGGGPVADDTARVSPAGSAAAGPVHARRGWAAAGPRNRGGEMGGRDNDDG